MKGNDAAVSRLSNGLTPLSYPTGGDEFKPIDLKKARWKLARKAVRPKRISNRVRLKRVAEARSIARPIAAKVIDRIRTREWPAATQNEMRQLVLDEVITELSLNWLSNNPKKVRCPDFRNGATAGRKKASDSTKK